MSANFTGARVVLCGDFNAHSQVWDRRSDSFGNRLLDFASQNNLIITKEPSDATFQDSRGMQSVIDVILTTASQLTRNVQAVVRKERNWVRPSDQFIVTCAVPVRLPSQPLAGRTSFCYSRANWPKIIFDASHIGDTLLSTNFGDTHALECGSTLLQESLTSSLANNVPQTKVIKPHQPWWIKTSKMHGIRPIVFIVFCDSSKISPR